MIKIIITLVLLLNLHAQETKETKTLTSLADDTLFHVDRVSGLSIHDAINRAIQNSPKIQAAKQVVIQDKMKVQEANAGHLPVITFSGDGGYETRNVKKDSNNPSNTAALTVNQKYKKVDLYLTITENLWNGGAIEDVVDEKEASLQASLYDFRDKLEALVVETASTYFDVVYAEIALKISRKNMQSYEKILNIVDVKEKNGAATKGDVNFIRANVDNAKTALVQREKTLADALAKYTYLLQTQESSLMPFEIESPLYLTDLNTSLKDADSFNAKILRQRAYIKATSFSFRATRGSFHPKVDFAINGESRNDYDIGLGKREKVNAMIMFNYNLYRGQKDEARAIRLLSKIKEQKFLYQDIERQLVFDIKVLNQSVSSLSQSLALTEKEVLAARKVVTSYWIAFQHGTQDLQALQLAQRNLNSAEQSYAKYKQDLLVNNYKLMRKTGVLLKFLDIIYKKEAEEFNEDVKIFDKYYDLK